ncbi:MAG TPA: hypothetical protein EYN67_01245 [Flavobacteriales bacterium]|nr:hypothetical protein [Flavobacteriales bacterium]
MNDPRELTTDQEKAWKSFKRAVKKCNDANVFFYQVLETNYPLNGNVIYEVDDHCDKPLPGDAWDLSMECVGDGVDTSCSFADDAHHAILK